LSKKHFSNPLQLAEYLEDGVAILDWFKKRRKQYFSTKDWELVGIEIELCTQASEKNPSVYWYGFIDVVLRHVPTNTISILDIKTSRAGWNKYQKADSIKAAQLIAYKNYFSASIIIINIILSIFFLFFFKKKEKNDNYFTKKSF
jgi:hypothetical protein